jgi:hypothetical protein
MDYQSIGTGTGSGILAAILTWFGFKQRLDRSDADIADLKNIVMYKDTHQTCSNATAMQITEMNKKLDLIIAELIKS